MKPIYRAARACALALLLAIGVSAQSVTLNEKEAATCKEAGGCALVTRPAFEAAMRQAYELGKAETAAACAQADRNRT